ncbi:MAG: hypothetical protein WCJ29_05560 [bacterium]
MKIKLMAIVAVLLLGLGYLGYCQAKSLITNPEPLSWKLGIRPSFTVTCEPWREDVDRGFTLSVSGDPHAALSPELGSVRIDGIATRYPANKVVNTVAKQEKSWAADRATKLFAFRKKAVALDATVFDPETGATRHFPLDLSKPEVKFAGCRTDRVGGETVIYYF